MDKALILAVSTQPVLYNTTLQFNKMIHKKSCLGGHNGSRYLGIVCLLAGRISLDVYFVIIIPILLTVFCRIWSLFISAGKF